LLDRVDVEADILIIGGGSAGCLAAIRAKELAPEARVVVFEKGHIHRSGSLAMGMDAVNIVAIPGEGTPEEYVESATKAFHGVLDPTPSYVMAERSFALLQKLERWGINVPKDASGNYQSLQVHSKGKFAVPIMAPEIKVTLSNKVSDAGVTVLNRIQGVSLLTRGGRVAGAVGLNVRTGEMVVCRASAVILASGGCARFGLPDSGYLFGTFDFPGNAGDGFSMAFRAGAELTGMEFTRTSPLIKDMSCPLLYIVLTRGAEVVNAFGEKIGGEGGVSMGTMLKEIYDGKGPIFISMTHLPDEKVSEIESILFTTERPIQRKFFKGRGIDFREKAIELRPTEVQLCGGHGASGIRVDERAQTAVRGLYAAGDVACVPGQHLTGAFVFGEVAAEEAVALVRGSESPALDATQVGEARERMERLLSAHGPVTLHEFEYKLRRLINNYIASPKNEYKLGQALEWAERLEAELPKVATVEGAHQLGRALEVEAILDCARLSATAGRERKETRWGLQHLRTDYPEADPKLLGHIVLQRGDGGEVTTSFKAVGSR